MCAPTLSDVTRSIAILEHWNNNWLEGQWLGCTIDRWLENKTWEDVLAWVDENEAQYNSDCGFFIRYCLDVGLDKYGAGVGNYIATGTYFEPSRYENPTIEGRNDALIGRSGVYVNGDWHEFDQAKVTEDVTHSFYAGDRPLHPFEGRPSRSIRNRAARTASTAGRSHPAMRWASTGTSRWRPGRWRGGWPRAHPTPRRIRTTIRCSSICTTRSAPA